MSFNINRYAPRKKSLFRRLKIQWKLYLRSLKKKNIEEIKQEPEQQNSYNVGCFIWCIIIVVFSLRLNSYYNFNYKNSIPMPHILGEFDYKKNGPFSDYIRITGLENIVGENTASLGIAELFCDIKYNKCTETRTAILRLNEVCIFVYNNEYTIKYKDNNKIIFDNFVGTTIGEIDLNTKTLTYSIKKAGFEGKPRRVEVITNQEQIDKLEKTIINKYLKKGLFKD